VTALIQERTDATVSQQVAEQRLRTITDRVPALISYMETDMRHQFVNRTFATRYGGTIDNYLGRTLREIVGDEGYKVVGPLAERALTGETVSYQRRRIDCGQLRHVEGIFIPDLTPTGNVVGLYVLIHDQKTPRKPLASAMG